MKDELAALELDAEIKVRYAINLRLEGMHQHGLVAMYRQQRNESLAKEAILREAIEKIAKDSLPFSNERSIALAAIREGT